MFGEFLNVQFLKFFYADKFNGFFLIFVAVPVLVCVAFLTLFERKILASIQRRRGPSVVGFFGLLQPFADGLKLFLKETILPSQSNRRIFIMAPILSLGLSLTIWSVVPFNSFYSYLHINEDILLIFAVSSLSVYGIILAGWSSNSKYAFLGSLRSAAQMVSYEVSIGFIVIIVLLCVGDLNLVKVVLFQDSVWFVVPFFPIFLMFFVSALAETNRPPFDLPEAEAELVSGYNVEYSAVGFAFFFIAEYANIIFMSTLIVIFFFGGWLPFLSIDFLKIVPEFFWFNLKILFFLYLFICVRATLPRYRYDQLMKLGWKFLLPLSLSYIFFISIFLFCFEIGPLFLV
jgi:NADH-quinone oxidoreductase subunit H